MPLFRILLAGLAAATLPAGAVIAETGAAGAAAELPRSMIWTAYDLGSSGYAEASGMANALQENIDTRVRIIPAGTSIGRLLPVATGKADYGFLANEAFFAAEGLFDFAVSDWGPQDLRIVLGRPALVGMATAADIGIETIADLKGRRIGFVQANPSVNIKNESYLAFGDLTLDDVETLWYGSYGALKTALIAGEIDAYASVTTSANMREIAASPRGLYWPPFPPADEEGWQAITDIISFVEPRQGTEGPALSAEDPTWLPGLRYPMITTYGERDADEVHALVAAIDRNFDGLRGATGSSVDWRIEQSGLPPADAPMHEGTVRYMKEKGLWTEEAQAWNEERLARLERVMAAWDDARAAFEEQGGDPGDDEAWVPFWNDYRAEHL